MLNYFLFCFFFCIRYYYYRIARDFVFFLFDRTRLAESMRLPCLIYLSTCTGVRTGRHYFT